MNVSFVVPSPTGKSVIRDYAGGLGFEADSGYHLPPLDLLQLATCLSKREQFRVQLIDGTAQKLTFEQIGKECSEFDSDVAIIEMSVPTFDQDVILAHMLSNNLGIKVMARIRTDEISILSKILRYSPIAKCIIAECEDNIGNILLDNDTRGTAYLTQNEVVFVPKALIPELDRIPFPDRDLLPSKNYSYPKLGQCTTVLSSRGCPYQCSYYCPYPLTQGNKYRSRSYMQVLNELKEIKRQGIRRILFRDPVFTFDQERIKQLCEGMIEENLGFEWWCETRADRLTEALLNLMSRAGCKGINVGVESGDVELRFATLKRGVTDELLLNVCNCARTVGIRISFLLMVGFPGEKRSSILRTADLIVKCRPYSVGIGFPVNHPGTRFDRDARANGWLLTESFQTADGSVPVLEGPGLNSHEMIEARNLLLRLFDSVSSEEKSDAWKELMNNIYDWSIEKPLPPNQGV
jgi:radical SAM superfamily enzyme YgiQ (UPF0313 family)